MNTKDDESDSWINYELGQLENYKNRQLANAKKSLNTLWHLLRLYARGEIMPQ